MIRKIGLVILWGIGLFARAQDADSVIYRSPVDFPMLLSANFGELRPNHFHGGLDIKTQGVTGKVVRAVADGYISRVAVFHGGYGQAVYVTHPDGHTSVYGHVEAFAPSLQERVREYQYKYETFTCDLSFEPEEFPVKAGDMIALSGNEGSSAGPHLHLELHRSVASLPGIFERHKSSRSFVDSFLSDCRARCNKRFGRETAARGFFFKFAGICVGKDLYGH